MAKVLERKKVNDRYKWKVSHIVENDEVWNEKFQAIVAEFQILPTYKGKLGDDATLLEFLKKQDELTIELIKLYLYAHMNSDADTRDDNYQQMQRRIQSALVMISSSLSFVETEICLRSEEQLLALSKQPEFSDYSYMLEKLAKDKKHVLSEEVEKVLADVGSFSGGFREAFSMFDNADVKFKKITIDGVETEMSHGVYGYALQSGDQATRQAAFESMFGAYKDATNTIGSASDVLSLFVLFAPVAFVTLAEHIADHENLSSIIGHDLITDPGLDRTLLGDGAGSIVGAGAVVASGTIVPPKSLVVGIPAKVKKTLTDEESAGNLENVEEYLGLMAQAMADPENQ